MSSSTISYISEGRERKREKDRKERETKKGASKKERECKKEIEGGREKKR